MVGPDAYAEPDRGESRDPSKDLIARARRLYRKAVAHQSEWKEEAREDFAFVAGDQWKEEDRDKLRDQLRHAVTFNRIEPIISAVTGSEVGNRQEVRYIPREIGDIGVNELLTGAAMWVRDQCDAEDEESDAFHDLAVCGMGWTETRVDFDVNIDGDILIERVDPLEMWWDPNAKKRNLSDAKWLFRVKDIPAEEFRELWPDADVAPGSAIWGDGDPDRDGDLWGANEVHYGTNAGSPLAHDPEAEASYRVVEFQWKERAPVVRAVDPMTGEIAKFPMERWEKLQGQLLQMGYQPQEGRDFTVQNEIRVMRAVLCGATVLEQGPAPSGKDFSIKCMTGKRDRNRNYWYGLVRAMKDPQRWANKMFSEILHIVKTNSKGGLLAEAGAFVNPRKAEDDWAKSDSLVLLNNGGLNKVKEKPIGQYPVAMDKVLEFSIGSMRDVSGVNLELLGMADRQQAGVLEYQRRQAGLTILGTLFDALRRYRKEQGRILLRFIQQFISDGRLIRIQGGQGGAEQYVPLVRQNEVLEYDVIVDETASAPNEKEKTFQIMMQLLPALRDMQVPTPIELLDYLPLPESLVAAWKQKIAEGAQPDPMQQQMQEVQMAQAGAEVAKTQADADKNASQALLNQVKALETQVQAMRGAVEPVGQPAPPSPVPPAVR